ncbi:hypothetical protein RJ639_033333, partial [Escallonia herrerae]
KLQDESNPDFVIEVVSLFFEDSEKLLNNLSTALQQHIVDYKQVDALVHQFKGSSSRYNHFLPPSICLFNGYLPTIDKNCVLIVNSIGAQTVKNVCVSFRNYCQEKNIEG